LETEDPVIYRVDLKQLVNALGKVNSVVSPVSITVKLSCGKTLSHQWVVNGPKPGSTLYNYIKSKSKSKSKVNLYSALS